MPEKALIIFIRNPELGKVKTRLAKEAGHQKALDIYVALLDHTRNVSLQVVAERHLFYYGQLNHQDTWNNQKFHKRVQEEGDLGHKMLSAFERVLDRNDKAVIIGSDCPQITSDIIEIAFSSLDNSDVVIGPSIDGGYYLLGMKEVHPDLFKDIMWSTEHVFDQTIHRVQKLQLTYTALSTLSDVDHLKDWEKYGWDV